MVQLVFVHGVATRDDDDYRALVSSRDKLFRDIAFPKATTVITNAYWGKDASRPAWNSESLPRYGAKTQTFSLTGGLGGQVASRSESILADMAQVDFLAAVDALFIALIDQSTAQGQELSVQELEEFSKAGGYALQNPKPPWITPGMTNAQFAVELRRNLNLQVKSQTFGLGDSLVGAAKSVMDYTRNLTSTLLTASFRDDLSPRVATFLSDVFVYLRDGAKRTAIRKDIADAVSSIKKADGEPLVLVGHSMGGVILVDMLLDPSSRWLHDVGVDLLLTVGSQPGFFEEMKLFQSSDPLIGKGQKVSKAPAPGQVKHWWNVYDQVDLLSFRCEPIFEGTEDFQFSSITGIMDAHSSYFKRPMFYSRLAKRLREVGL